MLSLKNRFLFKLMKVAFFAHIPPPFHGQSLMVQLTLEGLGGDYAASESFNGRRRSVDGIECYHINSKLSTDFQDIGGMRPQKLIKLCCYIAKAVFFRFKYNCNCLYYVPSPVKPSAILRDLLTLLLLRPFFSFRIFHWHAVGCGYWATSTAEQPGGNASSLVYHQPKIFGVAEFLMRYLLRLCYRHADLSIVLSQYNRKDAILLDPLKIAVVENGVPDDAHTHIGDIVSRRCKRLTFRKANSVGSTIRLLFLGHCTQAKGLFDAIEAVRGLNEKTTYGRGGSLFTLTVAGEFPALQDKQRYDAAVQTTNTVSFPPTQVPVFEYVGYANSESRRKLFADCDCLVFPSIYESFGNVAVEAMSFAMPVVAYRLRGLPDVLPPNWSGLATPGDISSLVQAIEFASSFANFEYLRDYYLSRFTPEIFFGNLASAIRSVAPGTPC